MKRFDIIKKAAELAYDEDADQVVGKIQGEWVIAHSEDLGRQAEMEEDSKVTVSSSGIKTD